MPFPSAGRTYVAYELYVTNFSASPMSLSRVDVLDAQESSSKPVATFEGEQLDTLLQPIGAQAPAGKSMFVNLTPDKVWEAHTRELPLGGMLVDFGGGDAVTPTASAH
jgi:hypothetical protein